MKGCSLLPVLVSGVSAIPRKSSYAMMLVLQALHISIIQGHLIQHNSGVFGNGYHGVSQTVFSLIMKEIVLKINLYGVRDTLVVISMKLERHQFASKVLDT